MRSFFSFAFLFVLLNGCYLSHGREDAPLPVPVDDAGSMLETDAGSVMTADAGTPRSDAGDDAGSDAFIPFDGDAGAGRILVSTTLDYVRSARPAIAQPGYRNRMDQRELCNSADEDVLLSSLDLRYADPLTRTQHVTLESGGRILGRQDGAPVAISAAFPLDASLIIPAHGCVIFDLMAEIVGMRSWVDEPSPVGTTHSGDAAFIVWESACMAERLCTYVGEAHGETSGMPYLLVGMDIYPVAGRLYRPVRASAIVFDVTMFHAMARNPHDLTLIAFDAVAYGATAGFLRVSAIVNAEADALAEVWLVMDGHRLSPEQVSVDAVWMGDAYGTLYLFTLREERVLEVVSGRPESEPARLEVHASLLRPTEARSFAARLIATGLAGIRHDPFGEPLLTGTLADADLSYDLVGGTITFPGPAITRAFGRYAGETESAMWLTSDHSEPDHGLASRDWTDGFMQVDTSDIWDTSYVP